MRIPSFRRQKPVAEFEIPATIDWMVAVLFKLPFDHVALPEVSATEAQMYARMRFDLTTPAGDSVADVNEIADEAFSCWVIDAPPYDAAADLSRWDLTEREVAAYRGATHSWVAQWSGPRQQANDAMAFLSGLAEAAANYLCGVAYDPMTSQILELSEMDKYKAPEAPVYMRSQVPYSIDKSGTVWITTQGLKKYGAPELQVIGVAPALVPNFCYIVNGLAACVTSAVLRAQGSRISVEDMICLNVDELRAYVGRPPRLRSAPDICVRLEYEAGEPDGLEPFLTVKPSTKSPRQFNEWVSEMVARFTGADDMPAPMPSNDAALQKAHERAISELPGMKAKFQTGLNSGDVFSVKFGFRTWDHALEYMWVNVTHWSNDTLTGMLINEPHGCPNLTAGQIVTVPEAGVYDWVFSTSDGQRFGAYTTRVVFENESE